MCVMTVIFTVSMLFYVSSSETIPLPIIQSANNYSYTLVEWGTPTQSFYAIIDTTDATSWIYNESVETMQKTFDPTKSSTFIDLNYREFYQYQTSQTIVELANETFTIDSKSISNRKFGVATKLFLLSETEELSGFLALNKQSNIIYGLWMNGYISNNSMSIDFVNDQLYFGPYIPSNIQNQSNATSCSKTTNEYLNTDWTFDIEISIDGVAALGTNSFKGVIDTASPYITIYARSFFLFENLWMLIDKDQPGQPFNCNYTSRYCSTTDIMSYMTIYLPNSFWNISVFREDILFGNYIQFLYDNDTDYTTDTDYVLLFGRPFLKHVVVSVDYSSDTLKFYSLKN